MRAGELRHLISIEAPTRSQDPVTGALTDTWAPVAESLPAKVTALSVREFIAADAEQSSITARIVIRYRPGITASMRVVHDGVVYDIEGVLPDPKSGREYLTLAVSGGLKDG